MQLSRIKIERFCGIRNLNISINEGLQIIAGPNNACKSTVLKAIHYFFQGFEDISHSDYEPQNDYYKDEGARSLTKVKLHFSGLSDDEYKIFSDSWLPRNKEFWVEARVNRSGTVSYVASNSSSGHVAYESLVNVYDVIYVPAVRAGTTDVRETETRKLFVAAKSVLAKKRRGSLNTLQNNFAKSANEVTKVINSLLDESRKSIAESLPSKTKIDFQFPSSDEILDLILSRTTIGTRAGTDLTVEDEGTGFQSLLSLGLLKYVESINRTRNLLLLVEEPEAFLHPQYQRSVADYLVQLSDKSQIIVTSHSSVIVDSVEMEHIARLIREPSGLNYKWEWTDVELEDAKYLARYCDAKNSEIIFADSVILCEGITDHNVITCMLDDLLDSTHHHSNISVIHGDGSALRHVAKLLDWFVIKHIIILDKDVYSGGKRDLLKNICSDKGKPIAQAEYVRLDDAKNYECANRKDASIQRIDINKILYKRSIYVLGGDIETAVVHSYTKAKIIECLGPGKLDCFNEQVVKEIEVLSGLEFVNRVNNLIGSKGWDTVNTNKGNKLKPHILHNFIRIAGPKGYCINSDMEGLSNRLSKFIKE